MKLAKTVIVSGLLFSSVLGSVNVGTITTMAAETVNQSQASTDTEKINVQYYIDGKKIVDSIPGFKKEVEVNKNQNSISFDELKMVGNTSDYYVANATSFPIKDGSIEVNLSVNTNEYKKVRIKYVDEQNTTIGSMIITYVKNNETVLMSTNYNAPIDYKFVGVQKGAIDKRGIVTFKVTKKQSAPTPTPAPTPSQPQTPTTPAPSHRPSGAHYTIQRVRITFVDQNSKNLVGYKQVTGKASFSTKIEAPKGYSFTNEKDATIKFDKKGNKDIKIFVKKMTSAPVKHEGVVTTTNGSYKRLYTLEGKMITNRALGVNSKWYTDQYATINGEKMYRVATNEWVKASDVF